MAEARQALQLTTGTKRLAEAVRAARINSAQRTDIVVDIREADRARLEIFAEALQPISDAVPPEDDLFEFNLTGGTQPRFWIDGTAQVLMARDRRTYRFVRDTRLGRVTLAESSDPHVLVERVTDYVAERIVERDKALAVNDAGSGRGLSEPRLVPPPTALAEPLRLMPRPRSTDLVIALSWLLIGIVAGAGALLVLASLRGTPIV
ncbi:hypothetical protein [Aureimonas jatrophae]|jgi:hypothetical protein|uniref:Uncharacterized protein n=1 Tax=Aureimonas jatrophae TaxID=1166073 RepID=A0A1H0EMD5_9HYPH|nr:hypothetical protein [Aureimonas jatrophae]MBB3950427.1 hypothetical protein [Aureimonas jatrophae]SDN83500.1 hypothetical protein SAMN05192530_102109 [Aureimonas jatrophae]